MDREIKRLLKLDKIPSFKLNEEEKQKLENWKKAQKPVEIKPKRKYTRRKKTTNEVKKEEKETSEIEVEKPQYEFKHISELLGES